MVIDSKANKLYFILFLTIIVILILTTKSQANFGISNFEIDCQVLENGDMRVKENITYSTNETRNGVIRNIQITNPLNTKNSAKDITLEGVYVNGEICQQVASAVNGNDKVYTYTQSGDEYTIKLFTPFKYAGKTVTYQYLLTDVATKYNDIGEIYWNFIGKEWDTPINNVIIHITLPQEAAQDTIYVYGHGSDNGSFTKNNNYITLYARKLSAYQAIDVRILFSKEAIPYSTKTINKNVLNTYREQEEGFTAQRENEKIIFNLDINQIAIVLIICVILIAMFVFFKYDKENKVEKIKYFREIPYGIDPAIMQAIYYDGEIKKSSYWVTFLDLVRKGVFKLEDYTDEYGTESQKIIFVKDLENLNKYQQLVKLKIINYMDPNTNSIDMLKLSAKMKNSLGVGYISYKNKIKEKMKEMFGEEDKSTSKLKFVMSILMAVLILIIVFCAIKTGKDSDGNIGILMFLGMITFIFSIIFSAMNLDNALALVYGGVFQICILSMMNSLGVGLLYIPYILMFITLMYSTKMKKYSKSQMEMKEKIKGLRRYLRDYSFIKDKEVEDMMIWEEYLIAAIALGLNRRTINYFYDYCRENLNSEFSSSLRTSDSYSAMYSNYGGSFYSYASHGDVRSSSSSGSGSSFSGSSGGFSGGSSSGGGGRRRWRRKLLLKDLRNLIILYKEVRQ